MDDRIRAGARVVVAALTIAALPHAARAQERQAGPMPAAAGAHAITVQGHGTQRYAVKTLQFVAMARGSTDESSVIAAMRAAGVDDPSIGPIGNQFASGSPSAIRGVIRDVSRAKVERVEAAATAFIAAHPGLHVDSISFTAAADGCVPYEQQARAEAFADARRRAAAIAALAGLTIDGVASVNEFGGCPSAVDTPLPNLGAAPGLDLATLTAQVVVNQTVTFAVSQR